LKERKVLSEVLSVDRPKNGGHIASFAKPAISMMIAIMCKPFVKKEMKSSALEIRERHAIRLFFEYVSER
jgi:hypothetical protein